MQPCCAGGPTPRFAGASSSRLFYVHGDVPVVLSGRPQFPKTRLNVPAYRRVCAVVKQGRVIVSVPDRGVRISRGCVRQRCCLGDSWNQRRGGRRRGGWVRAGLRALKHNTTATGKGPNETRVMFRGRGRKRGPYSAYEFKGAADSVPRTSAYRAYNPPPPKM